MPATDRRVENQHRTDVTCAELLGNLADRGARRDRVNETALTRQDIGDEHGFLLLWWMGLLNANTVARREVAGDKAPHERCPICPRPLLRWTGLHHVSGLGARAIRACRDGRFRLPPETPNRAGSKAYRPRPDPAKLSALGGAAGRRPFHRHGRARTDQRHVADTRRRLRDGEGRAAQQLRARPQSPVLHLRRRRGLATQHPQPDRRHVRDGFLGLSRLPRQHDQGAAGDAQPRHGPRLCAPHAADVARQGRDWGLAHELGGPPLVNLVLEHTHTCYDSVRGARHGWGYGCGECPACALRKRGFIAWREGKASL